MDGPTTRRRLIHLASAGLAVGVAGCTASDGGDPGDDGHDSGHDDHDTTGSDGPAERTTVTMYTDDGDHFDPHVAWVEVGGTVEWRLESGVHTATAYTAESDRPRRIPEGAEAFDSGVVDDGSYEHTFDVEGVYDYYCEPHEEMGMIGTVVVGRPDPDGDEPGLADPQEAFSEAVADRIETLNAAARATLTGETS